MLPSQSLISSGGGIGADQLPGTPAGSQPLLLWYLGTTASPVWLLLQKDAVEVLHWSVSIAGERKAPVVHLCIKCSYMHSALSVLILIWGIFSPKFYISSQGERGSHCYFIHACQFSGSRIGKGHLQSCKLRILNSFRWFFGEERQTYNNTW